MNSTNRPSYVTNPDLRFANTMLDVEYRDYAVNGENLIDKRTGEMYIKRPLDGKVVSFHQNKKYVHDLVLELRVLLTNNEEFTYPKDNESAYYIATDYDLVTINDEALNNICDYDTIIPNGDIELQKLNFKISKDSNGFFCRPTSRDTDKPVIEFLTNQYNTFISNYNGTDQECLDEKNKLDTIEKWKDSNVILNYTTVVSDGTTTKTYTTEDYIRINEEMCVMLPIINMKADFPLGYNSVTVTINSLKYHKIHFILNHKSMLDESFATELEKFIELDNKVYVNYVNIIRFIDSSSDVVEFGNEFIIAALDVPYVRRYMSKLSKLKNSSEFVLATKRPTEDDWSSNTVWAERVRDVTEGGVIIYRDSESNIKDLESFIAKPRTTKVLTGIVQTDPADLINFYSDETEVD